MLRTKLAPNSRSFWNIIHCDLQLLIGLLVLMTVGLATIYSAGGQDMDLIQRQLTRLGLALGVMMVVAQIPPMVFSGFVTKNRTVLKIEKGSDHASDRAD